MRFFTRDSLSRAVSQSALALAAVALVSAFLATPSFAGLFTNDMINDMHDSDYENAYRLKAGGDATKASDYVLVNGNLQAGDLLLAIVEYTSVSTNVPTVTSVTPGQLTAVSLLRLDGGAGTNASPFTFTSATTTAWQALTGTSAPGAGIVASVYENDNNPQSKLNGGGGSPTPGTSTAAAVQSDIATTVTSGNLLWNFGFTSTANGDGTVSPNTSNGEGWQAVASANPNIFVPNETFNGALSLLPPPGAGAPELNTVDKTGAGFTAPGQFNGGTRTDIQIVGQLQTGSATGDFTVGSGGNYYVNIAPEPTSLVLMGLGFASFAGARLRRRKASVVA